MTSRRLARTALAVVATGVLGLWVAMPAAAASAPTSVSASDSYDKRNDGGKRDSNLDGKHDGKGKPDSKGQHDGKKGHDGKGKPDSKGHHDSKGKPDSKGHDGKGKPDGKGHHDGKKDHDKGKKDHDKGKKDHDKGKKDHDKKDHDKGKKKDEKKPTPTVTKTVVEKREALPVTGSATTWFAVVGAAMVLGGSFLLGLLRRRREE